MKNKPQWVAHNHNRAGWIRFDLGPLSSCIAAYWPKFSSRWARTCGRKSDEAARSPISRLFWAGGKLDATPDIEAMERQIAALAPQDVGGLTRYMRDNREKLAKFRPILESPFSGMRDLLRLDFLPAASGCDLGGHWRMNWASTSAIHV